MYIFIYFAYVLETIMRSEEIRKRLKDIDEFLLKSTKRTRNKRNAIGEHMNSNWQIESKEQSIYHQEEITPKLMAKLNGGFKSI